MKKIAVFLLPLLLISCAVNTVFVDGDCPVYGIDLSHRQGFVDWKSVKSDSLGIKFVYAKASEGSTWTDPRFVENMNGAMSVGIHAGGYHFFRMSSSPELQFETFKNQLLKVKYDLVPVVDIETYDGKTSAELRNNVGVFVNLFVREFGYYPIIYGPEIVVDYMCPASVVDSCMFFIGKPGDAYPILSKKKEYSIWQYSSAGQINGISRNVDLDVLSKNVSLSDIMIQ